MCRIVDAYGQYYEKNRTLFFNPDVTLAALDLEKMDDAIAAADRFFDALKESIENGDYALINQARSSTKAFGLSVAGSREKAYDLLDLKDFAQNVEEEFAMKAGVLFARRQPRTVQNSAGTVHRPGHPFRVL